MVKKWFFYSLILQFPFLSQAASTMRRLGDFLMVTAPAGPGEDVVRCSRRHPEKPDEEPTDFRDGEGDVLRTGGSPLLAAPIAKAASASRARVICRCQPCQLRTS